MHRRTIGEVLATAQSRLSRLTPREALAALRNGWTLVDTRSADLIARDGAIPEAICVPLSVLEWRVDATSGHQEPALAGRESQLILICEHGYSSSLAAVRLQDLGFIKTTDVIGGYAGWLAAGLPTSGRRTRGAASRAQSS